MEPTINHTELLNSVYYNQDTGIFTRTKSAGNTKAGSPIGNIDVKGYVKALVLGKYVKLHRLAWFYVHGTWPNDQIDHINGIKTDNRITNLRICDTSTNCLNQRNPRSNNNTGYQGVHRITKTGRYRASCTVNGIKHQLGIFATAEEASESYKSFKSPYIPEVSA